MQIPLVVSNLMVYPIERPALMNGNVIVTVNFFMVPPAEVDTLGTLQQGEFSREVRAIVFDFQYPWFC